MYTRILGWLTVHPEPGHVAHGFLGVIQLRKGLSALSVLVQVRTPNAPWALEMPN